MRIAAGGHRLEYKLESWISLAGVYLLYHLKDELYQFLLFIIYTHQLYSYTKWKNRKTTQAQRRRTGASDSHKSTPVWLIQLCVIFCRASRGERVRIGGGHDRCKILIRFTNKEVIVGILRWIACEITCALPDAIPILQIHTWDLQTSQRIPGDNFVSVQARADCQQLGICSFRPRTLYEID